MFSDNDSVEAIYDNKQRAVYTIGMENAVVDLVVIRWIVAKLKLERRRNANPDWLDDAQTA